MAASMKRNIAFSVLNQEKIEKIHEKSLYLMKKVGMRISGDRTIKLLKENGVTVTADGLMQIPEKLVEKALKSAPKELILYTRQGEPSMMINKAGEQEACPEGAAAGREASPTLKRGNQVYFGTHADQLELVDPFTNQVRKFLKKDIQTMCKVADYLPNIFFVLSVGMTADVDPRIQTQSTFMETVKNFSKTINFSSNDVDSLKDVINIAATVAGGLDKLQEKPFIFNYCEPIPP